jgi:hypothetical protein
VEQTVPTEKEKKMKERVGKNLTAVTWADVVKGVAVKNPAGSESGSGREFILSKRSS